MPFEVRTYVVQTAAGKVVGVKLTRWAAQALSKKHAPARVMLFVADKEVDDAEGATKPKVPDG